MNQFPRVCMIKQSVFRTQKFISHKANSSRYSRSKLLFQIVQSIQQSLKHSITTSNQVIFCIFTHQNLNLKYIHIQQYKLSIYEAKESIMCQCLVCSCWWCSCCDIACLGMSQYMCCFGCWCCKHDQILAFHQDCCNCCEAVGFGGACCCLGSICCAPQWLRTFSYRKNSPKRYEE